MKKLFIFVLMVSVLGPALFAENIIAGKEMREAITKTVKTEISDNYNPKYAAIGSDDGAGVVNVIKFRQDIYNAPSKYSEGNEYVDSKKEGECIAIVIDDAWAVASKKCLLSKGDKMKPIPGTVGSSSAKNFKVIVSGVEYNADSYKVGNVFLLRIANKNFASSPKANLAFVKSSDESEFRNNFKDGYFEADVTKTNKSAYDAAHDAYEDDFHSYLGVDRKTYKTKIKEVYKDEKTKDILADIKTKLKDLRAGDPLFYIENGKRYLLGFANATNLWDNFDDTRSNKVILLTLSDMRQIWEKVKSIDPDAAQRIHDNMLAK